MLRAKYDLKLPLSRPASLQDVPEPLRKTVEETYISAAREAGEGFLSQGDLSSAWTFSDQPGSNLDFHFGFAIVLFLMKNF